MPLRLFDGPFPDTDAPYAPASSSSAMIFGSEFSAVEVASPLIIMASQYLDSMACSHALWKTEGSDFRRLAFPRLAFLGMKMTASRSAGPFSERLLFMRALSVTLNPP